MNTFLNIFKELNSYSSVAPYIFGFYCLMVIAFVVAFSKLLYLVGKNLVKGRATKLPVWFYIW